MDTYLLLVNRVLTGLSQRWSKERVFQGGMLGEERLRRRWTVLSFGVIGLGARSHRIRRPGRKAMLVHLRQWLRLKARTSMFAFMTWADSLVVSVLAADRRVVGGSPDCRLARGSSRAHGISAAESAHVERSRFHTSLLSDSVQNKNVTFFCSSLRVDLGTKSQ